MSSSTSLQVIFILKIEDALRATMRNTKAKKERVLTESRTFLHLQKIIQ